MDTQPIISPKKPNWFSRHKILTGIGILVVVFTFIGSLTDKSPTTSPSAEIKVIVTDFSKLEITQSKIVEDSIGTPIFHVTLKNNFDKAIDAVELEAYFYNNFDEPVGEWDRKVEEPFQGRLQEKINSGALYPAEFNLALYDSATKVKNVKILRIHFVDGTELN
ncbi:hypothetical protein HZB93_03025 [Candidatus Falkowbacteria bacterium]|nr:hypothetical protein [Candidatus Falkowbacteria bacterium]